ncbi:MAG: aspartyl/glutamyl-tRNA amidotransferase subunit C [Candidatus Kaiserbacteria bacterium]|nr:aspartyl/glutamyl-tRNA amidotransferase subunit C [Candidatus Kaiserbacteria bacterium]
MISKDDIKNLAKLARLEVAEAELERLQKELPEILSFVEMVQKASTNLKAGVPEHRNITRPDENPIESGTYTETLLKAAPAREGDRIAVKQVISRKK